MRDFVYLRTLIDRHRSVHLSLLLPLHTLTAEEIFHYRKTFRSSILLQQF